MLLVGFVGVLGLDAFPELWAGRAAAVIEGKDGHLDHLEVAGLSGLLG